MSLIQTAAPAVEPISLAEVKAQLRVDGTAEDAFIASLIVTSRLQIEAALGLALIAQEWRWTLDDWPRETSMSMPLRPISAIQSVEVKRVAGLTETISSSLYHLDGSANPARLVLAATALPKPGVPAEGIAIRFTAGFGSTPGDTPAPIRHALMLLVAHWFENRDPVATGAGAMAIPETVASLLAPYRQVRL